MAGSDRWYFAKEYLLNTPSRKCGIDYDKELSYRQQSANLIQDMGQRLQVTQLCINTAIVYMHRFYMFHSFTKFHRNAIAACALFLAAKVEEQPRKLEHVIRVAHMCLHRETPSLDTHSEEYIDRSHDLVVNENIMLQTLGFDIAIEHPHTFVVKCCQLIPQSSEGKDWFFYVDKSVTAEILEELTSEFLAILDKCPSRLRRKTASGTTSGSGSLPSINNDVLARLAPVKDENKNFSLKNDSKSKLSGQSMVSKIPNEQPLLNSSSTGIKRRSPSPSKQNKDKEEAFSNSFKSSQSSTNISHSLGLPSYSQSSISYLVYKEKKEKEKTSSQISHHSQYSSHHHQHSMHHHQSPNLLNKDASNRGYNKTSSSSAPPKPSTASLSSSTSSSSSLSLLSKDKIEQGVNQNRVIHCSHVHPFNSKEQKEINKEKERQIKERNKLKPKAQDHLWGENNKIMSTTNTSSEPLLASSSNNNPASQSFFDNLMNKPASSVYNSNYDSNLNKVAGKNCENPLSIDNENSNELRKELTNLKMEFSDNDSNASNQFNLSSLPPLTIPENSQEPKSSKSSPLSTNCSFMSIFTSDNFDKHDSNFNVENIKLKNANSKDYSNTLSSILEDKPKYPPPILSPLQPEQSLTVKSENLPLLSTDCDKSKLTDSFSKVGSINTTRNTTSSSLSSSSSSLLSIKSLSHLQSHSYSTHLSSTSLHSANLSSPTKQNQNKIKSDSTVLNKGTNKSPKFKSNFFNSSLSTSSIPSSSASSITLPPISSTLQIQCSSSSLAPSPKRLSSPTLPSSSLTSLFSVTQTKTISPQLSPKILTSSPSHSLPPSPIISSSATISSGSAQVLASISSPSLLQPQISTSFSASSILTSSTSQSISFSSTTPSTNHSGSASKIIDKIDFNLKKSNLNKSKEHLSHFYVHHEKHYHRHHRHHKHEKHRKDKHKHKHKQKDKAKEKTKDEDLEIKMTLSLPKEKKNHEESSLNKSPIKLKISKKKLTLNEDGNESLTNEGLPKSLRIVIPKERLSNINPTIDSNYTSLQPSFASTLSSSRKRKNSPKECPDHDKKLKNDLEANDFLSNRKQSMNVTSNINSNSNQFLNLETKFKKAKEHVNDGKKNK